MLRREKLYAAQLKTWRDELNDYGTNKLSKTKPGPVAKQSDESKQIEKLTAQVKRLQRELDIPNGCICCNFIPISSWIKIIHATLEVQIPDQHSI